MVFSKHQSSISNYQNMNILYLTNTKQYSYHKKMADDFIIVTGGRLINIADEPDLGQCYHNISGSDPDVIITFDLAGHVFRTGTDKLSLNNIYARFAHILFHKPDYYGHDLKTRQNLSMFTYVPLGMLSDSLRKELSEVPNILEFVQIDYKSDTVDSRNDNQNNISLWWNDFRKAAML